MAVFKKLSEKIPLTKSELLILVFLSLSAASGLVLRGIDYYRVNPAAPVFDYSESEKLFLKARSAADVNSRKAQPQLRRQLPGKLAHGEKININEAGLADLVKLPGIGEHLAKKILEFRQNIGYFSSTQDLLKVKGIGNSKLEKIKDYIFIKTKR